MKRVFIQIPDPPKGKHSGGVHSKIRSDKPEIAIAKVERAVVKRLRKQERNKALI